MRQGGRARADVVGINEIEAELFLKDPAADELRLADVLGVELQRGASAPGWAQRRLLRLQTESFAIKLSQTGPSFS